MKFRDLRGADLGESIKTIREVKSLNDIEKLFPNELPIKIKYYCHDDRLNWDTYIVTGKLGVIGFTNGNLK